VDIRDLCDTAIMASSKKIVAKALIDKGSKIAAGLYAIASCAAAAITTTSPKRKAELFELRL
jgi:hypothetical protein